MAAPASNVYTDPFERLPQQTDVEWFQAVSALPTNRKDGVKHGEVNGGDESKCDATTSAKFSILLF